MGRFWGKVALTPILSDSYLVALPVGILPLERFDDGCRDESCNSVGIPANVATSPVGPNAALWGIIITVINITNLLLIALNDELVGSPLTLAHGRRKLSYLALRVSFDHIDVSALKHSHKIKHSFHFVARILSALQS